MSVSVIIPTLNEESCLAETLDAVRPLDNLHEIIVVDGGSTDRTQELAQQADTLLTGARGRAAQMNLGARHATGDVLFFLHADCIPSAMSLTLAERTLQRQRVVAGCFQMRVRSSGFLYRMIDAAATMRTRLFGVIYGDQGMFISRERFWQMGGFPELRLMEDVQFSLRLRRYGKVVVVPQPLHVSPRRWQKKGIIRQTLRNWTLTALVAAGAHPDSLAKHYPHVR